MKARIAFVILLIAICSHGLAAQATNYEKVIAGAERAFQKAAAAVSMPAPGCAVGVSLDGRPVFEKAFGLAEMEHNNPNTPQTIFESGSVAKQFTAAALVLLEQDGKLKLDDDVRKYIPELPEYEKPITIRHLLTHTAGLRDWGSVMQLTGAGRGDRVITQELAFDVIIRQKHLDFAPGAEYSYSNSGYQLAAIIVERVSGKKFGEFTHERIFKPLGMNNSSWRDNYQRLIPGRAQGYSRAGANAPWVLNMPFMNVVGNGGMLTTVGDWLKWNAALDANTFGEPFVAALETQGVLNDGRKISYALGLVVDEYREMRDVSHGGSTAGYQTFLARYPNEKVSVAVLCNGTSPSAGGLAASITDEVFSPLPPPRPALISIPVRPGYLEKFAGLWRNEKTRFPARLTVTDRSLRFNGQPMLTLPDDTFLLGNTRIKFTLDNDGKPVSGKRDNNGDITHFTAQSQWSPAAADLKEFAGDWHSEEAQAAFTIAIEGDKAFITQRPSLKLPLQPLYKDHFSTPGYVVWVTRDAAGKIDKLHVGGSRMRDMWFERARK
ncbi:MAG: serine hydrolase [Acidobacteria bacterium]|nr:serine hydrolase [Acidobacteriota bacterium]